MRQKLKGIKERMRIYRSHSSYVNNSGFRVKNKYEYSHEFLHGLFIVVLAVALAFQLLLTIIMIVHGF